MTDKETSRLITAAKHQVLPRLVEEIETYAELSVQLYRDGKWQTVGDTGINSVSSRQYGCGFFLTLVVAVRTLLERLVRPSLPVYEKVASILW